MDDGTYAASYYTVQINIINMDKFSIPYKVPGFQHSFRTRFYYSTAGQPFLSLPADSIISFFRNFIFISLFSFSTRFACVVAHYKGNFFLFLSKFWIFKLKFVKTVQLPYRLLNFMVI